MKKFQGLLVSLTTTGIGLPTGKLISPILVAVNLKLSEVIFISSGMVVFTEIWVFVTARSFWLEFTDSPVKSSLLIALFDVSVWDLAVLSVVPPLSGVDLDPTAVSILLLFRLLPVCWSIVSFTGNVSFLLVCEFSLLFDGLES